MGDIMVSRNKTKYEILYSTVKVAGKRWYKDKDWRTTYSMIFYGLVGNAGLIRTPYMSLAASTLNKEPTPDHCFSPRLVFRAMMDQCPEILKDRDQFYEVVDFCRHVVKVTKSENDKVKYDDDHQGCGLIPIVYARTIDKYDDFGWIEKGRGLLTERKNGKLVNSPFPLKHLVPTWLTAFEEKCMKKHGYL